MDTAPYTVQGDKREGDGHITVVIEIIRVNVI